MVVSNVEEKEFIHLSTGHQRVICSDYPYKRRGSPYISKVLKFIPEIKTSCLRKYPSVWQSFNSKLCSCFGACHRNLLFLFFLVEKDPYGQDHIRPMCSSVNTNYHVLGLKTLVYQRRT